MEKEKIKDRPRQDKALDILNHFVTSKMLFKEINGEKADETPQKDAQDQIDPEVFVQRKIFELREKIEEYIKAGELKSAQELEEEIEAMEKQYEVVSMTD